ncbi:glycoside hydrolase family 28 protein [Coprobacter sp.]
MVRNAIWMVLLALCCFSCQSKVKIITKITTPSERCEMYTVQLEKKEIPAVKFRDISYVHCEVSGETNVQVKCSETIRNYEISPRSADIKGTVQGEKLSFKIPKAGYYVVRINEGKYLFLLADAPEQKSYTDKSRNIINVRDYLTDHSGTIIQTEAIQKALNDASGSGKVLFFPAGVYLTGTLSVKSNTDIYLAPGALIQGSPDRKDYPSDGNRLESDHVNRSKEEYTDNGEFMTFSRLILVDEATNVHIFGRGTIDGNGTIVRAQGKPANLIRVRRSENVLIEGIVLRNPAAWNTHIQYCDDVTIRDVKIINDFDVPNTDGVDPDASHKVLVDHCFAYCNDDNIAIKTTNNMDLNRNLEDITVSGCVFLTRKSSLKVGTETKADVMKNILFEDNDVIVSDRGMALYCNDGSLFDNIRFENNRFEYSFHKGQQRGIHFVIKNRYGKGIVRNVLIKDCVFYEAFPKPSQIFGLDVEHPVDGIIFENFEIAGKKIFSAEEATLEINDFVRNIQFK